MKNLSAVKYISPLISYAMIFYAGYTVGRGKRG